MLHNLVLAPVFIFFMLLTSPANAQNTGGVFGPVVNEDDRAVQYRITYDPDSERAAQRIHYQQSIDGDFRPRLVVQGSSGPSDSFDIDFVQAELLWQLTDDDKDWQMALRLDGQIRTVDGRGLIGVNWVNQFDLGKGWQARFLVLSSVDIGSNARDGIFLQTRANVTKKLGGGVSGGVEMFNFYGTTGNLPDFDDQTHQIGPFVSVKAGKGWSLFGSALFGVTGASPDQQLRLWITRGF